jgi:hypothetical protein
MARRVEWWFSVLCLVPALALVSVYGEALLASAFLGHWPVPSVEDPKALPTAPLHWVSTGLFLAVWPSVAILVVVVAKSRAILRWPSPYWTWLGIWLASMVTAAVLSIVDPVTQTWWMD